MPQFTIALLKPNLAVNPIFVRAVLDHIARKRMSIIAHKTMLWSRTDSEEFYKQHRGRFFYNRLVEFTTSGPIIALLLSGDNSICNWRGLMGPTKVFKVSITSRLSYINALSHCVTILFRQCILTQAHLEHNLD